MKIECSVIVLLNAELKKKNTRYHVRYKDETTGCIEPPGECCITENRKEQTMECIREYYGRKGIEVRFSDVELYFTCSDRLEPEKDETAG